ncbi:serine hydrolase domain-containing protein [Sorangium sp. So ce1389]|uniref:serine hydrolase domain-containing protein n=1 Tax=Sorangium sp. So ce1389 TaxID=3133336 RepID=UPI003F61C4DA
MRNIRLLGALLCAAGAGCTETDIDDFQPDSEQALEPIAETTLELTGATHPINCGYDNGRLCQGAGTLANGITHQVPWDPCYGGAFTWTASANFEANFDRMCVGGVASPGTAGGCSGGVELTGSGSFSGSAPLGKVTLSIATDVSIQSAGLTSLQATCDEPIVAGVYRTGSNTLQQALVLGRLWDDFVSDWNTQASQGRLLSRIGMFYDASNTARFDGLFVQGSGPYGLNAGMTLAQLQSQKAANALNGMEISDVEVQQTSNGVVYIGVWRPGTRLQEIYDGTAANFWAWSTPFTNTGYRPSDLETYYDSAGVKRYTVVMTKTPGQSGWASAVGLPYDKFVRAWRDNTDAGWQLTELETHISGGVRYYDGFFHSGGAAAQDFVGGSRLQQFSTTFLLNKVDGLELVDFDRYKEARTSGDPMKEEKLVRTSYPVVAPTWMAEIDDHFMNVVGGEAMGYTVALMQSGELLGASSVGYAQAPSDGNKLMTPDAQWDWLSITKALTALAALKVSQDAGINVATEKLIPHVQNDLPGSTLGAPNSNDLWNITLLQAMTHLSNLKNGGCDNGPGTWESNIKTSLFNGPLGTYNYSGYNACMLRLFVEEVSGMSFPAYVDEHIFRPFGIHNVDCLKDAERVEVLGYSPPPNYYASGAAPYSEPNTYCAAAGIKATALDLLSLMQGIRTAGPVFNAASLQLIRNNDISFGLNFWSGIGGSASAGGRPPGLQTYVAQFPVSQGATAAHFRDPANYTSGIDAVFFLNSGLPADAGWRQLFEAMAIDPTP